MSGIVIHGSATDLRVLEALTPSELFAAGGTVPVYEAIKKEVSVFVLDASTEPGRKEIASLAYKVAQSKNFLDKVGKVFNSELKEKTKAVDAERSSIWDKLEALQKEVRAPLDAFEAAEEARIQAHKDAMTAIGLASSAAGIDPIKAAITDIENYQSRQWDEFADHANQTIADALKDLSYRLAAAEQAEKDQLELEALRAAKAEQEAKDAEAARQKAAEEEKQRIQAEANARATREAEERVKAAELAAQTTAKEAADKAAKEKADAEERIRKADEARVAAEARAKLEAEQAVIRERERAAAEQKKIDDAALARENDRKHHAKINNEAKADVQRIIEGVVVVSDGLIAEAIVIAIAKGEVPHVKISY